MKTRAMTKTILLGSIVLMFLGTSMLATAYHIAEPVGPGPQDNPATQWIGVSGLVVVICESEGPNDKQNPNPGGKIRGEGGLCYASSQHDNVDGKGTNTTKAEKKTETPRYDSENLFDVNSTKWSTITPTCVDLAENKNPNGTFPAVQTTNCPSDDPGPILGTWFAQLAAAGNSCSGAWGNSYYYPEFLAWAFGSVIGSNDAPNSGTGHVTFFADDPGTAGSYDFENDIPQATLDAARANAVDISAAGQAFCS